jgi:hypothetical protein
MEAFAVSQVEGVAESKVYQRSHQHDAKDLGHRAQ